MGTFDLVYIFSLKLTKTMAVDAEFSHTRHNATHIPTCIRCNSYNPCKLSLILTAHIYIHLGKTVLVYWKNRLCNSRQNISCNHRQQKPQDNHAIRKQTRSYLKGAKMYLVYIPLFLNAPLRKTWFFPSSSSSFVHHAHLKDLLRNGGPLLQWAWYVILWYISA